MVVDSTKMLRDFADERELRGALYDLTGRISQTGTVLLLVGEYTPEELRSGIEFSLADGIIQLEYEAREPVDRRWLRIAKMRGGSHRSGKHTFRIGPGGVEVFPRIETLIPHVVAAVSGQVPSGIPGLDELMSGGAKQGDATLVTGPSGVGKTIFGLRWLAQGMEQGKRCLYVTFQDTADQLIGVAAAFGWDLMSAGAAENVSISYVPMGDLDLDVLATAVRSELSEHPISRIVIDSLSELAFAAREAERFPAYMRSLVGLVRAAGSSLLITSETSRPRARRQRAGRTAVPVRQRHRPALHRRGIPDRPGRARRQDAQQLARDDAEQRHHHRSRPRGRKRARKRDRTPRLERATNTWPAGIRPARRQELGRTFLIPSSGPAPGRGRGQGGGGVAVDEVGQAGEEQR